MKKTLAALLLGFILGSSAAVAQNAQHFQAADGGQDNPSYTFFNDATTGIYRSGNGQVAITSQNSQVGTFSSTGLILPGNLTVRGTATITGTQAFTGALTAVTGTFSGTLTAANMVVSRAGIYTAPNWTASAPTYTFTGDTSSGMFLGAVGDLRFTAGSTLGLQIQSTGVLVTQPLFFTPAASRIIPGATSISLRNNANTADNLLVADNGDVTFLRTMRASSSLVSPAFSFTQATGAGMTLTGVGSDVSIRAGSATNRLVVSDSPAGIAVTGQITATTTITSSGATSGVGYATGAGGVVTQATSKSTGVTLNTITGQITMNAAALAASTTVAFTLTDSAIAATDLVVLNHVSAGTAGSYTFTSTPAAGSSVISVRNVSLGSLSEAIVIQFTVVKAVTS